MALITPGPLVGRISGNLGGQNFAQTRNGLIVRRRLRRPRRLTDSQAEQQLKFKSLLALWAAQDEATRTAWNRQANLTAFPNRLGIPRHLSGRALYLALALGNLTADAASPALPTSLARSPNLAGATFAPEESGPFNLSYNGSTTPLQDFVYIQGSRPHTSNPRAFLSSWRYFTGFIPDVGSQTENLYTAFSSEFGDPAAGETIGIRTKVLCSGRLFSFWQPIIATVAP